LTAIGNMVSIDPRPKLIQVLLQMVLV